MSNKNQIISDCFDFINEITCGQFVVLRGTNEIPDLVSVNNDIDIMVCGNHVIPYLEKRFNDLNFILHIPRESYMYGAEPHYQFINNQADIKFDIVTGLYYRSPLNRSLWIPVNNEVQKSMIVNKVKVNEIWKFQSSNEDELIHIICHCIFDKQKVSDKYVNRINVLKELVNTDRIKFLLEKVFYASSETIFNQIYDNPINLYENYITYTKY